MRYYVYCVVGSVELDRSIRGIQDQAIELIGFDDLSVVASRFDDEVVSLSRENIRRHESVVRSVLAKSTPLPFRFGTTVTADNLADFVKARRQALLERLANLRDCVEMSVKVIWDPTNVESVQEESISTGMSSGAAFLHSKRKELMGDEKLNREARGISDWLGGRLGDLPRAELVNVQPKERLVVAGSYLVQSGSVAEFREKLRNAEQDRPELHFLTSGPWPPYTFANIDLEFETQFGVS